jgi:hypothetical protein
VLKSTTSSATSGHTQSVTNQSKVYFRTGGETIDLTGKVGVDELISACEESWITAQGQFEDIGSGVEINSNYEMPSTRSIEIIYGKPKDFVWRGYKYTVARLLIGIEPDFRAIDIFPNADATGEGDYLGGWGNSGLYYQKIIDSLSRLGE